MTRPDDYARGRADAWESAASIIAEMAGKGDTPADIMTVVKAIAAESASHRTAAAAAAAPVMR